MRRISGSPAPTPVLASPEGMPDLDMDDRTAAVAADAAHDVAPPLSRLHRLALGGRTLRQHTARGTLINAAFTIALNTLGLLRGFIVAGFLVATDYGVWGIVVVALGTLMWLKQVGINEKFIQQDEADQEAAFQKAFTLEAIVNAVFLVLIVAAVPLAVWVYDQPKIAAPGLVIALVIPAYVLQTPTWVFYRNMDFVKQRSLQALDPIVGFVVTVALAVGGAGYWAFVLGTLAGAWAGAIVAVVNCPYRLRFRYDRGTLREYVGFSAPLFVAGLSGMLVAQVSVVVGSRQLGLAAVGAISLATTVSQYTHRVDELLTSTLYPAICAVKDRTDLLFESFVKSNRLALMWGMPFGVGAALFASDLVAYGIGEKWRPAVHLMEATSLTAAVNQIGFNWDAFYRARAQTRPIAMWSVIGLLGFAIAPIPLLVAHGLDGYAVGLGIVALIQLATRGVFLARLFDGFDILRHAVRSMAPTVPAAVVVLGMRVVEPWARTEALAVAELVVYLGVTVAATWAFERDLLREVAGYLGRRPAPAAPQVAT